MQPNSFGLGYFTSRPHYSVCKYFRINLRKLLKINLKRFLNKEVNVLGENDENECSDNRDDLKSSSSNESQITASVTFPL